MPCQARCLGTQNHDCRRVPLEHKGYSTYYHLWSQNLLEKFGFSLQCASFQSARWVHAQKDDDGRLPCASSHSSRCWKDGECPSAEIAPPLPVQRGEHLNLKYMKTRNFHQFSFCLGFFKGVETCLGDCDPVVRFLSSARIHWAIQEQPKPPTPSQVHLRMSLHA